jgi:hypothetical protein
MFCFLDAESCVLRCPSSPRTPFSHKGRRGSLGILMPKTREGTQGLPKDPGRGWGLGRALPPQPRAARNRAPCALVVSMMTDPGTGASGAHKSGYGGLWRAQFRVRGPLARTIPGMGTSGAHNSGYGDLWRAQFRVWGPLARTIPGTGTSGAHNSGYGDLWPAQ